LVLQADSTTWATQMTLLLPKLRDRVIDVVGPGVIDDITIVGPTQPATFRGRWRVKGRGVRDTYG
jgi:predicted nucleic acid-binding Zn ribbon protein